MFFFFIFFFHIPTLFSVFIINSTILSNNRHYLHHLHQFLAPEVGNISQWLLCYRQSLHGDLDSTFHDNCDGKENTVSIVKEKEFVFGGYTDIPWGNCTSYIYLHTIIHRRTAKKLTKEWLINSRIRVIMRDKLSYPIIFSLLLIFLSHAFNSLISKIISICESKEDNLLI